ncbi:MAG: adenosine kinase, partial [Actinobacteria bacterium]|nr:adenosine kinase [Actinomycetota bacterium]
MSRATLDAVTIGNAMVDVIATVSEDFLTEHNLTKASMMLVDDGRSQYLMSHLSESFMASGGSVANTSHGLASLGGRAGFIGKIADDDLGRTFTSDLTEAGVSFFPAPKDHGLPTGRCVIVVTPDGQRTMNTYLGAGAVLHPGDVSREAVQTAEWVFLEGYLFDKDDAKEAFRVAAHYAHAAGRKVALTLSDSFCVQRHHADFVALVNDEVDLLFANEHELTTLYGTDDFSAAVGKLRECCPLAVVTRSKRGSAVVTPDEFIEVPALPVDPIVDATGAGDMYA